MRTTPFTTILLFASLASAAIQCAPTDKDGTPLQSSEGEGNFVRCTYEGAGPCEYFPANGSFSSGSSQCPAGIAQDTSNTTQEVSSVGSGGAQQSPPASGSPATFSSPPITLQSTRPPGSSSTAPPPPPPVSSPRPSGSPAGSPAPSSSSTGAAAPTSVANSAGAIVFVGGALLGAWLL
ncbi:hypothetical protein MIND_00298500 [Mycena indigotica]|uniref:Uncharacterized protein n=1 Tax=Mycena indigotica TaxID=2126181 RepID=A0A8H6T3M9_9AGAR|nr:uncharacterized protein MIND_00298500 [Mycena indigotica]KAF7309282.1 hypothetical protein MIND_00298500 [Mycena indigotica]